VWLLLALLVLGLPLSARAPATAQGAATVILGPINVGVAESGTVEGRITCPGGCAGFALVLNFNRDLLRVERATVGPFLGAGATASLNRVDNALGVVWLNVGGGAGSGEGVLFTLQVGGLLPGAAEITVNQLSAADSSGAALTASGAGTTITVVETGKIAFFSPPANDWEVAFTSERDGNPEIYAAAADGSNVRRLTDHSALDGAPAWSPDCQWIAFHSERDGGRDIYLMRPDGSDVRRLTDHPALDSDPAWSPDSRRLAFTSERDGNPEIYVMNVDGSGVQRLTNDPGRDTLAAWSPDGRRIAFSSDRGGSPEIMLMDASGGNAAPLTNLFGARGWYAAWSPDGATLGFSVERDSDVADIYRITAQGAGAQRLTAETDRLSSLDWSPDGAWLAYGGTPDGNKDVLIMGAQGQPIFRLTDDPADDYDPDLRVVCQATSAPCAIRTDQDRVVMRLGPAAYRAGYAYLPPNQDFTVIQQVTDAGGTVWYEIDKSQIAGTGAVESLWVSADVVQVSGDCAGVPVGTPPPPVTYQRPTPPPPGQWGGCGTCATCGHPANECVTAPDGACLWDPATCVRVPPGDGCLILTIAIQPNANAGSVSLRAKPTCPTGAGYAPGTPITAVASPSSPYVFHSWEGSCPGAGSTSALISFDITYSCTLIAVFG